MSLVSEEVCMHTKAHTKNKLSWSLRCYWKEFSILFHFQAKSKELPKVFVQIQSVSKWLSAPSNPSKSSQGFHRFQSSSKFKSETMYPTVYSVLCITMAAHRLTRLPYSRGRVGLPLSISPSKTLLSPTFLPPHWVLPLRGLAFPKL